MRNRIDRFLKPLIQRADKKKARLAKGLEAIRGEQTESVEIPLEFNGRDYVSFLLYIDAEIEHGLMLQYLYAAYSLGGEQVPVAYREKVRGWQEIILGISKEEMGHFISVQNALRLIGAPLNFGRQDYPWDTPFYPFPFKLEPLTLGSLAKYVYAESPPYDKWPEEYIPYRAEIYAMVHAEASDPHRVGELFDVLKEAVNDPDVIPDEAFLGETYPFQASFAEWGRGYSAGARGDATNKNPEGAPDVLVEPQSSRTECCNAIDEIAEQGEAPTGYGTDKSQPSHFDRFMIVYTEMKQALESGDWSPSRNLAINPYIGDGESDPNSSPSEGQHSDEENDEITNPEAVLWGHLLNTRYRMLLMFLTHSFYLEGGFTNSGSRTPRGTIINSTFGEMYNIRAITNVLVRLPLNEVRNDKVAGPPFLLPYTLELPIGEASRWQFHKNVIEASRKIIDEILRDYPGNERYLYSLIESDDELLKVVDQLTQHVTPV